MIELLNMDCMDFLRDCEDNAFDLACVDPPYGIGKALVSGGTGRGFHKMVSSDADKWDIAPEPEYFMEIMRVSKNQIIWGGNYFNLPPCKKPLCWDKIRPNQKNLSEWEYAWTSFEGRAEMFKHCANGGFVGETRIHPTQKPVRLYSWLMENFTDQGDRILDTHLGSGSSAIAAHYGQFDFVGIEIDEDYFNAAKARFEAETAQLDIFG